MPPILITDGDQRAALAITRSLGGAGYRVIVCSSRARSLAGVSRYAAERVVVPDPLRDPDEFFAAVEGAARRHKAGILLPVSEAALLAILPRRESLGACVVPFPDATRFIDICDKARVLAAASRHDIAVPRQFLLESREDVACANGRLRFPVVLKPARSIAVAGSIRVKSGAAHARDSVMLANAAGKIPGEAFPVLLQERIIGSGIGVFVLLWDGELRAAFAHRRIREKPPSGGVSVLSESIALDPDLLARSVALLRDFDWQGVAMVEYKLDERTGVPYLMEVNGRFWGSLQLAIDAGVDFPNLLVAAACGEPTPPVGDYKVGTRLRWEWGDVDNLLLRLRRSPAALALSEGSPGRMTGVLDFARAFGPGTRGEVFRLDDPRPFLRETLDWLLRR